MGSWGCAHLAGARRTHYKHPELAHAARWRQKELRRSLEHGLHVSLVQGRCAVRMYVLVLGVIGARLRGMQERQGRQGPLRGSSDGVQS